MKRSWLGLPRILPACAGWALATAMLWAGVAPVADHHAAERDPWHTHVTTGALPPTAAHLPHLHTYELPHRHDHPASAHVEFGLRSESVPGLLLVTGAADAGPPLNAEPPGAGTMDNAILPAVPFFRGIPAGGHAVVLRGTVIGAPTPPPETGLA